MRRHCRVQVCPEIARIAKLIKRERVNLLGNKWKLRDVGRAIRQHAGSQLIRDSLGQPDRETVLNSAVYEARGPADALNQATDGIAEDARGCNSIRRWATPIKRERLQQKLHTGL